MDKIQRDTLKYMEYRPWIAVGAILSESPNPSDTEDALHWLRDKGYLDYQKYFGDGNVEFYRSNKKGVRRLLPPHKQVIAFLVDNWMVVVGTIAAVVAAVTGIISLIQSWKNF